MKKFIYLISSVLMLSGVVAKSYATEPNQNQANFKVAINYDRAVEIVAYQLQNTVAKKAGLFNQGIKINVAIFKNDTIFHVVRYQMDNTEQGELAVIDVAKTPRGTDISVIDEPDQLVGTNLHVSQKSLLWFR